MAYYYLKLYHEILDDPKMGRLSDHLYRRVIEIFLIASASMERDGYLPPVEDMAWKLRTTPDELAEDLQQIAQTKIVQEINPGNWYVTNFAKRQAAVTGSERIKRYRERQHLGNDNDNEPVTSRYTELRIKNIDKEEESEFFPATATSYPSIPDPELLESIFTEVTDLITFPSGSRANDLERLDKIYRAEVENTINYLRPFWQEWIRRNYNKSNTAWLDWAVSRQIPAKKSKTEKPFIPEEHASEVY